MTRYWNIEFLVYHTFYSSIIYFLYRIVSYSLIHYPQIWNSPFHLNILKCTWELKFNMICRHDKKLSSKRRMYILLQYNTFCSRDSSIKYQLSSTESCENSKAMHLMLVNFLLGTIWNSSSPSIIKISNHKFLKYFATKRTKIINLNKIIQSKGIYS